MTSPVLAAHPYRSNAELIEAVYTLGYIRDDDLVLDPTYGLGRWWTRFRPAALVATDIDPDKAPDGETGDFTALSYESETFDVVAFDPPYKLNGTPSGPDGDYGVDVVSRWQDRHALIRAGMDECSRVLRPGGYLLLKCQDQVCSGRVRWQTIEFAGHGEANGLVLWDSLHLLGGRPQPAGRRQKHARRNLSTLLVFRKPKRRGPKRRPLAERFAEKVNTNGPVPSCRPDLGPCHLWTGAKATDPLHPSKGYGYIRDENGRVELAHRVAWILAFGPIGDDLQVDHLCLNIGCVNPDHFELVELIENVRREWEARRAS
jgi:SAM-dependent methyltransferase